LRSSKAAFTLIELMVVVAVLGLGMTIVFLKVDTLLPGSRLEAGCKQIVTDLELLRSQSSFSGLLIYLEYDVPQNSYRSYYPFVFDEENEIIGAGETEIFETAGLGETVVIVDVALGFHDEEESTPLKPTIGIRPDGSLTGHIVHLMNTETEKQMSIRISSLTGFAEILPGRIDYEEVNDGSF